MTQVTKPPFSAYPSDIDMCGFSSDFFCQRNGVIIVGIMWVKDDQLKKWISTIQEYIEK